jgi:hypothetical protein
LYFNTQYDTQILYLLRIICVAPDKTRKLAKRSEVCLQTLFVYTIDIRMTLVRHVTWNCGNNSVHILAANRDVQYMVASELRVQYPLQVSSTSRDQVYSYIACILRSIEQLLLILRQGKAGSTSIRDKLERCFSWLLGKQKYMNRYDICAMHTIAIRKDHLNIYCCLDIRYLGMTATNRNSI